MKATFILIFIVWSRFFGLFIVLPVLSVYVKGSAFQIGLAVGSYALAQIIFALPFGKLSDIIGRKKALILGICIFGLGSLICAFCDEILYLIFGRFVQGAGAVGAVATAFVADIVADDKKSKYMAFIGAGIGMAFILAMIVGPFLAGIFGLSSLFFLCALLCLISLVLLFFVKDLGAHSHLERINFKELIKNKNIGILCLSNLFEKMFLNILFVSLGLILVKEFDFLRADLWKIYASATIFGFLAMGVSGAFGDKGKAKELFLSSVLFFIISLAMMIFAKEYLSIFAIFMATALFFIAFSLQEPILQSQTSKITKVSRGAALGLLNTCGYLGSFLGSMLGIFTNFIFFIMLGICVFWLFLFIKLDRI